MFAEAICIILEQQTDIGKLESPLVRTEEWRPAVMEAAVCIVCIESTTVVCAFNALVPTLEI